MLRRIRSHQPRAFGNLVYVAIKPTGILLPWSSAETFASRPYATIYTTWFGSLMFRDLKKVPEIVIRDFPRLNRKLHSRALLNTQRGVWVGLPVALVNSAADSGWHWPILLFLRSDRIVSRLYTDDRRQKRIAQSPIPRRRRYVTHRHYGARTAQAVRRRERSLPR